MKLSLTSLLLTTAVACAGPDNGSGDASRNRHADVKQGTEIGNGNKIDPDKKDQEQPAGTGTGAPDGTGKNEVGGAQPGICPGVLYGNFCVQLSGVGQSCSDLCQGRDNVSPVTFMSFGTQDSGAQCTVVLGLLLEKAYEVSVSPANDEFPATGCSVAGDDAYVSFAGSGDPDAKRENLRRVCVCK